MRRLREPREREHDRAPLAGARGARGQRRRSSAGTPPTASSARAARPIRASSIRCSRSARASASGRRCSWATSGIVTTGDAWFLVGGRVVGRGRRASSSRPGRTRRRRTVRLRRRDGARRDRARHVRAHAQPHGRRGRAPRALGGALGLFVGGLVELGYQGTTNETPVHRSGLRRRDRRRGRGGAGDGRAGVAVARPPDRPRRGGLGALAGAAAGSPLVFQNVTETKSRAFLATTLGGTVIGGTLAWVLTKDSKPRQTAANPFLLPGMPTRG